MEISTIFDAERQIRRLRQVLFLITLLFIYYSCTAYAIRVNDKIYSTLQSNHYCSRRLNATHQMGCSSELTGNVGVVWVVEDQADLNHVLKDGPTPPYVVILRRLYYTRKNLLEFKKNQDRVAGVVFIDAGSHDDPKLHSSLFSPEDTCPNQYSGLYVNDTKYGGCKQNQWQQESPISGLLYDDIPYPIFLMNEKESIEAIESCFSSNNIIKDSGRKQDTYPLCSMQLDSFMLAASDSKTCLNSHSIVDELLQSNGQRCYTVENQNVFAYYKPTQGPLHVANRSDLMIPDTVEPQSVVLLVAKLSSLSMFADISPGADSTITSIVTLLAVAEALGKVQNNTEVISSKRNIAFALLDSEPFDYTGSSRMVFNMKNDSFPNRYFRSRLNATNSMQNTNLEAIDYLINLDQLASYQNSSKTFLHVDPVNLNSGKLAKIADILTKAAKAENVQFEREDPQLPLPPSPAHEFIKQSASSPPDRRLLGLVLSNYAKTYSNLFYNSIYDDSHNVFQNSKEKLVDHIARVASFVAKSLYHLAFETNKVEGIQIDKRLVEKLLECYLIDADCSLFTKVWQAGQELPTGPIQTYKDPTKRSDDMNGAITSHLLSYFIGEKMADHNITKCYEENKNSLIYNYNYVNGQDEPIKDGVSGLCIRSQVLLVPSTSPAFELTEDGISVDSKYPAWTISLNSIRNPARLYLKPSPFHEWTIFLHGLFVTIISFYVVYHIRGTISTLRDESETQTGTST